MFSSGKALLAGLCWLSLSVALLPTGAYAGLLYSNHGMTNPLNQQPLSKSQVTPLPGGQWSELQNDLGDTLRSNGTVGAIAEAGANHLADDFTIPPGMPWTIGYIDFYGFVANAPATPSPFLAMNVQFSTGRPGDPGSTVIAGDLTTNVLSASIDMNTFRINNTVAPAPGVMPVTIRRIWKNRVTFPSGITLQPGTYWIEWQAKTVIQASFVQNTIPDMRAMPGWNARQLAVASGIWKNVLDTGAPGSAPDLIMDFPFEIYAPSVCGDSVVEGNEQCDDGNTVSDDGCDNNCTLPVCGNGAKAVTEQCDDGNTVNGDGCDNNCTVTACGNGIVTAGEACDDGNSVNYDGCDNNCTVTACRNGVVSIGEACDDGNSVNGDGCDNNCTVTACRNGVVTAGEACDDGNSVNGDGCDNNCTATACGNGMQDDTEQCDDGNTLNGDGCSASCRLEFPMGAEDSGGGCASGCKVSGGRTDWSPLLFWIALTAMASFRWRRKRQTW